MNWSQRLDCYAFVQLLLFTSCPKYTEEYKKLLMNDSVVREKMANKVSNRKSDPLVCGLFIFNF